MGDSALVAPHLRSLEVELAPQETLLEVEPGSYRSSVDYGPVRDGRGVLFVTNYRFGFLSDAANPIVGPQLEWFDFTDSFTIDHRRRARPPGLHYLEISGRPRYREMHPSDYFDTSALVLPSVEAKFYLPGPYGADAQPIDEPCDLHNVVFSVRRRRVEPAPLVERLTELYERGALDDHELAQLRSTLLGHSLAAPSSEALSQRLAGWGVVLDELETLREPAEAAARREFNDGKARLLERLA
jgi:hypothetical protein